MATELNTSSAPAATAAKAVDYAQLTFARFAGVDPSALEGDELKAYAKAAADIVGRVSKAGVIVDPRNGFLYVGGKNVGNVSLPVASKLMPSTFRPLKTELGSGTALILDAKQNEKRIDSLTEQLRGSIRFMLAPLPGNGINLRGQTGKSVDEWLEAAVGNKSGQC